MVSRDHLVCILSAAELALNAPQDAMLHQVFLDIFPGNTFATLVWTWIGLVETSPRLGVEVLSEHTQLTRPLAASLVVGAVHLETHHTLLKVNISKVVEVGCLALGAGVVDGDALLNAALAVVASTAHHLARLS